MRRPVVSFCVYGDRPTYLVGAIRNAQQAPFYYPGWEARFYCAHGTPADVTGAISRAGATAVVMPPHASDRGAHQGMFWRFLPAAAEDAGPCVFRDTDSRFSPREAAAVRAWLEGGRRAHIMRDHPHHDVPILGGMWGVRGRIDGLAEMIDRFCASRAVTHGQDQAFLERDVYPLLRHDAKIHDSVHVGADPFPTERVGLEFVGMRYDEDDRPFEGDLGTMREYLSAVRPAPRPGRRPGLLGMPGEPRGRS